MNATAESTRPHWCEPQEWAARVQLAATYRVFHQLGWTELIFNHITLRVPGPHKHFLINPFGLAYDEIKASNLVKIDLEGRILSPSDYPINPAGFVIHSAIHANVEDAHCVMHTHTTAGLAVACMESGLASTNFYSAQLHGMVAYHDFEGITVHDEEKPRLLASMGDKRLLILRSHGLLAHGVNLAHAFALLWTLNRACEIQVVTDSMRGQTLPIDPAITERSTRDALQFSPAHGAGENILAALIRRVDRHDPSYKE
ncbi:ribulose-5-phosphate 4-epimerase/fuculose-1-phosphate aldolase [Paraburkholderia bannensis]|jgi:ribulose-5-phosphate 4-epimerase/fuculose-1-phosphate aldolase|uniref:Ribulose-5-phosphate 4-epimerase/fuculose-1-phosphate aldolase n=1 Tax=Paraburkholderia bannensis TaxID=765414 RepID=A0A7W9WWW8_9BURK|nr:MULTISPECIES: class II aldolase/adducin family protein [Paraburkholderia]MBB3261502.1 ribulose-5-phosphate 4-epimerase/fuculose-1-phosphate aldolase [Paraburkholderia sp. WP4_3_2]MBB6106558.1 ribulose-5-phosphate 4-epimerase/fuculose-1-phosphate aldolase [Paraburkholderia bannensis]